MKRGIWGIIIFWLGLILLVVDLATYYYQITAYFTALGQILLIASIVLLAVSFFLKNK